MTLDQWFSLNDNQFLKRVAELMVVNRGRLDVNGNIGSVLEDPTVNRYGRLGLTLNEAFELQYYKGVIDALTNAYDNGQIVAKAAMARLTREAKGQVIEIASPEQSKLLLGRVK